MVAIFRRHRVEIQIEPHMGVLLAQVAPLSVQVFVRVDDLVSGDGIGDSLDLDRTAFFAINPIVDVGEGLIGAVSGETNLSQ